MANPYSAGAVERILKRASLRRRWRLSSARGRFRGLVGHYAIEVRTQRTNFDEPLDDLIVTGLGEQGVRTKLHLQIKWAS